MVAFLGAGDIGRRAADQAIEAAAKHADAFGGRTSYAPGEVRLLAPVPRPRVIRDFLTFEGHMLTAGQSARAPVYSAGVVRSARLLQRRSRYGVGPR